MSIPLALIFVILGLYLLTKGSDTFVDGAASIARYFNIPTIVIGLTIVAFGTSTPELLVSLTSAFTGSSELALSGIIGSNISNTLLIMGAAGVITPMIVQRNTIWKEIPLSLAAALVLGLLALDSFLVQGVFTLETINSEQQIGTLYFTGGLILLIFFGVFVYYTFGLNSISGPEEVEVKELPLKRSILFSVLGIVMLGIGSSLVVNGAITIASALGISEKLIGLTLVALGTSLPELFTSINASLKKQSSIVIGNVVGSNIFNVFLALGLTTFAGPIAVVGYDVADLAVLIIATIFLFTSIFIFSKHIVGRIESGAMLSLYFLYVIFLFWRE
jgi:cation:H+ antiporter